MSVPSRGLSLLELVIALALLGLLTSFAAPAIFWTPSDSGQDDHAARSEAIFLGRSQTVLDADGGGAVTFLPDGRALVGEGSRIDPLTGLLP
ncbi:MAG: Tfp pilus assembly protein FimT/FimU [Phycisphaerales bacterium JB038]